MKFVPGEILTARKLQQLSDERSGNPTAGLHGYQGQVSLSEVWTGWIKITSSGTDGTYDWSEMVISSNGTLVVGFRNGTKSGSTPAREINGNNSVPNGRICRAWRSVFEVHFQGATCS